jgi:hypothetical protein
MPTCALLFINLGCQFEPTKFTGSLALWKLLAIDLRFNLDERLVWVVYRLLDRSSL